MIGGRPVRVDGNADALVTFNRRDFGDVPGRYGIAVLSPGQPAFEPRRRFLRPFRSRLTIRTRKESVGS